MSFSLYACPDNQERFANYGNSSREAEFLGEMIFGTEQMISVSRTFLEEKISQAKLEKLDELADSLKDILKSSDSEFFILTAC